VPERSISAPLGSSQVYGFAKQSDGHILINSSQAKVPPRSARADEPAIADTRSDAAPSGTETVLLVSEIVMSGGIDGLSSLGGRALRPSLTVLLLTGYPVSNVEKSDVSILSKPTVVSNWRWTFGRRLAARSRFLKGRRPLSNSHPF
jgi:hypothetical protein